MVPRHALTALVHHGEGGLRRRRALVGGEAVPLQRFRVVPRHAMAELLHQAEIVLRAHLPWSAALRHHFSASRGRDLTLEPGVPRRSTRPSKRGSP